MNGNRSGNNSIVRWLTYPLIALGALSVAACGGGGGGGGPGASATGTFFKLAEPGPDVANNSLPFSDSNSPHRLQQLYLTSEINGSGLITRIGFRSSNALASAVNCPSMTFRLGHSDLGALTDTFADNVETGEGSLQTVLNGAAVTIPVVGAGEYFDVPLTTPFYYNGVDNLVVDIERGAACSAEVEIDRATFTDRMLFGSAAGVSGTLYDQLRFARFTFTGGDNEVIAADRAGDVLALIAPGSGGRAQFLILASDIVGSGPITGIQFQAGAALGAPVNATYQVTLSHVTPATTTINSTTFSNNVGSNATVVAQGVSANLPEGATRWWIPLNGSFNYDGTSNLLVDVTATGVSGGGFSITYQSTAGQRVLFSDSALAAEGEYPLAARGLEPKLRFAGGTVDIINGSPNSDVARWFTANAANAIDQHLYLASELGTGGSIHRMACRKLSAIVTMATDYTNFEVVMAHTTETTLDTTYASNLINPVTVFNGTYALPENLHQGDWIEIPFTTPFNYNAAQNLVIQVRSDPGANPYACSLASSATQFPARRVTDGPRDALVGSSYNHLKDIRLWINR